MSVSLENRINALEIEVQHHKDEREINLLMGR